MSTYTLLREAIEKKMQVTANYHGYYREMCPHALGQKNGLVHCLAYQFAGESSSKPIIPGSKDNWRCLNVGELTDVHIQAGEWHTADNHTERSRCIDVIDVEVDF